MSCIFHAVRADFDVDTFLKFSTLIPDRVWHLGERRLKSSVHQDSGFTMVASNAEMDNFEQQVCDAIEFLKKYQSELKELQEFMGDKDFYLDFGVESRDVFVQCERFPPELLRLAGNLNIAIECSRYCR